ncbi:hypothetical protein JZ751_016253 [Albula glossodonta]|uniref:Uncharacterized protein n=1 Tax=Albula glossodonta TaxID=121402 RepID=A0A8T2MM34_9TELE|nr:hypothetical protein JZ751_016253 [Albula glossodonta]
MCSLAHPPPPNPLLPTAHNQGETGPLTPTPQTPPTPYLPPPLTPPLLVMSPQWPANCSFLESDCSMRPAQNAMHSETCGV